MKLKDYYFECPLAGISTELASSKEAIKMFDNCQLPCELAYQGEVISEKYYFYDDLTDQTTLMVDSYEEEVEIEEYA